MILNPGDVIRILCGQAGYPKFHLYVDANAHGTLMFLYLNSENGFVGDLILQCAEVPFLPPSRTGETVISFSMMPRFQPSKLASLGAIYCGKVDALVAAKIRAHVTGVRTLARSEKQLLISGAAAM